MSFCKIFASQLSTKITKVVNLLLVEAIYLFKIINDYKQAQVKVKAKSKRIKACKIKI